MKKYKVFDNEIEIINNTDVNGKCVMNIKINGKYVTNEGFATFCIIIIMCLFILRFVVNTWS